MGIGLLIPLMSELMGEALPSTLPGPIRELVLVEPFALESRIVIIGVAILALIAFTGIVQLANGALIAWVDTRVSHQLRTALACGSGDVTLFAIESQAELEQGQRSLAGPPKLANATTHPAADPHKGMV